MAEVQLEGVRLHVQRLGAGGTPVVFLHGLIMDNLSSWFFTAAPAVARHSEVILYDLRGHGRSERPAGGYGLEGLCDDLEALLGALGLSGPVRLVGNSFGGLLALAFTLRAPERVAGLALVDALAPVEGWGAKMAQTLGLKGEARDLRVAESFKHWLGRHSARKRNRLAENARALVEDTDLVEAMVAAPGWSYEALSAIEAPVLGLYGEASDVLEQGQALAAHLPAFTLETYPGCTHSLLWERTEALKARLARWAEEGA